MDMGASWNGVSWCFWHVEYRQQKMVGMGTGARSLLAVACILYNF